MATSTMRGQWILNPIFDDVTWFFEGMALALIDKKWGVIDMTGKWIIEPKYDSIEMINARSVRVKIAGKWQYLDGSGKEIDGPIA